MTWLGHPSPLFWWERGVERHLGVETDPSTSGPSPRRRPRIDQWLRPERAIYPTPTTANGESVDVGESFEKCWGGDVEDKQGPDGDVTMLVCYLKMVCLDGQDSLCMLEAFVCECVCLFEYVMFMQPRH